LTIAGLKLGQFAIQITLRQLRGGCGLLAGEYNELAIEKLDAADLHAGFRQALNGLSDVTLLEGLRAARHLEHPFRTLLSFHPSPNGPDNFAVLARAVLLRLLFEPSLHVPWKANNHLCEIGPS
jgi:hypothetical protein